VKLFAKVYVTSLIITYDFRKGIAPGGFPLSNATKKLREQYLNSFMMRKWISEKMPRLKPHQIKHIYVLIKQWTGEDIELEIT
jgi:hypothetical protein